MERHQRQNAVPNRNVKQGSVTCPHESSPTSTLDLIKKDLEGRRQGGGDELPWAQKKKELLGRRRPRIWREERQGARAVDPRNQGISVRRPGEEKRDPEADALLWQVSRANKKKKVVDTKKMEEEKSPFIPPWVSSGWGKKNENSMGPRTLSG